MKISIKNMVCIRCIIIVKNELSKLGIHYTRVYLGGAEIGEKITAEQQEQLQIALLKWGLELVNAKKLVLIEKIKNVIIEYIHYSNEQLRNNFSVYISDKLHYDYTYLANQFSQVTGTTIEQFIISHKIERVKELLTYDELNLTEIAWKLNYSSVAHLSNQFKKVTGLTPSNFKAIHRKQKQRRLLENL